MSNGDEKVLLLEAFEKDGDLQVRVNLDDEGIESIKEAYLAGETVPPVKVMYDGEKYYLTDGHRRCEARKRAGHKQINCHIKHGTRREAILEACCANREHDKVGLRRTHQDKRRAVTRMLMDEEWCRWSDAKIAEFVGVSNSFVGNVRKEVATQVDSPVDLSAPRLGADGKERKPRTPKPKPAPEQEAEPTIEPDDNFPVSDSGFTVDDFEPSFEPEEIKPPKNGAVIVDFPQDAKIREHFAKLTRLFDDRLECVGGNVTHRNKCAKALAEAFNLFEEWASA